MYIRALLSTILIVFCYNCNLFAVNKTTVKDYGAVGDGIIDDTQAIQTAINFNKTIVFPPGEYLINSTLIIPSSRSLYGEDCVIKAYTPITMIKIEGGDVKMKGLSIYGSGKAVHGVVVASKCRSFNASDCSFHGFFGTEKDQANGIYCSSMVNSIRIKGCDFYDIDAPLNGEVGDVYGSCQGILVMKVAYCEIKDCNFRDIRSLEDGDCIQVYGGKMSNGQWGRSAVTIKDCTFHNIWHRAIKFQASKCSVYNCNIYSDSTRRPSSAIDVFGDNCTVMNTMVNLDYGVHALAIAGNDFKMRGCDFSVNVSGNYNTELTKLHSDVVYCTGERCKIENNIFQGGYIGLYAPKAKTGLIIRNNVFKASLVRNIRLYDSWTSNVLIKNNVFEDNIIPIDLHGGDNVHIVNNIMKVPKSYISALGGVFSSKVKGNTTTDGSVLQVQVKAN